MQTGLARALALTLALVPTSAFAHSGIGDGHGFGHGFAHPLGGLDHVLAMVTVGVLGWQLGGRALLLMPAIFVAVMAAGGMLAVAGAALPGVELGLAASVIALGALVALGAKAPLAIAMTLAGLFALFHGHAHGLEMPPTAAAASYGAGFLSATALLHGCGMALGALVGRIGGAPGRVAFRLGGTGIAIAGLALFAQVV
jgi:urease accessory protein